LGFDKPIANRMQPDRSAVLLKIHASRIYPRSASGFKMLASEMDFSVTYAAQGDEILFHIASQQAARLHVMDVQILGTSASLASPAITVEYLLAKPLIGIRIQAKPRISLEG
jgi:hypothetical protein